MSSDLIGKLAEKGISLRSYQPGNHYTACPECSESRSGANKRKPCLSVAVGPTGIAAGRIEDGQAVWNCHHCGWRGGVGKSQEKANGNTSTGTRRSVGSSGNRPGTGGQAPAAHGFRKRWW